MGVETITGGLFVLLLFDPGLLFDTRTFELPPLVELFLSFKINHAPKPPRPRRSIVATTVIATTDEVVRPFGASGAALEAGGLHCSKCVSAHRGAPERSTDARVLRGITGFTISIVFRGGAVGET